MSDSLYHYNKGSIMSPNSKWLKDEMDSNYAGLGLFRSLFTALGQTLTFHDRTGVITTPIRTKTIPGMELPAPGDPGGSYSELCDRRAIELLDAAESSGRRLAVMYSGGVDSTMVMISLIKNCDPIKLRRLVMIIMDNNSIAENRLLYENHISGRFDCYHSQWFSQVLGDDSYILVTGEGNDQLFGSKVLVDHWDRFGLRPWEDPVSDQLIIDHFASNLPRVRAEIIFNLLDSVCQAAPIPIDTMYKWWWWINLSCKWQNVFMRCASYTSPENRATLRLKDNYVMFFDTVALQQWSMANSNNLIGDSYKQYKQTCKDAIFDFNGDAEYRDYKVKIGSLKQVINKRYHSVTINEHGEFSQRFDKVRYIEIDNSFARIQL